MKRLQASLTKTFFLLILLLAACGPQETAAPPQTAVAPTAIPPTVAPATQTTRPAATAVSQPTIGDPYTPELGNTGYDVQRYTINIALDPAVTQVQATTTLDLLTTTDNLARLALDFIGYDITALTVNDTPADFSRTADKLLVTLPAPQPAETALRVAVTYSGTPVQEPSPYIGAISHLGLHFVNGESIFVLAEPDGARYWFPANDHPRDKATFRFEIAAPVGQTAVANGALVEIDETAVALPGGGTGHTHVWEHNHPMATYLAIVAVGEYERLTAASPDGVPIRSYAFPRATTDFERAAAVTGEAIDWMSDLFGPYPFEAVGFVTADVPGASLETQTMILLSTNMLNETTVIHELAHMWFGDWVSLHSWSEMWRNEGFATYISLMWEHRDDPEELALEMAGIRTALADNGVPFALGSPPPASLFSFYTYFGGAVMVHDLRETVGDEAFFAGLRRYFELYGGGTASDAEFQAVMEEAAGQSLDDFFNRWLTGREPFN